MPSTGGLSTRRPRAIASTFFNMGFGTLLNILLIIPGLTFCYLARNGNVDQGVLIVSAGLFIFTLVARFCVFNKEYLWEHPLLGIALLFGIFICGDILYVSPPFHNVLDFEPVKLKKNSIREPSFA